MPPGDRQRSVRSDRSLMLGVLCIACYFRVYAARMFHACNTSSPSRRVASPHCANFHKAPRGVRVYYRLALSERGHARKRARTWHRFAKCSLRLSPPTAPIPFNAPRYGSGGRNIERTSKRGSGATTPVSNRLPRKNFEINFFGVLKRNVRALLYYDSHSDFREFRFQLQHISDIQIFQKFRFVSLVEVIVGKSISQTTFSHRGSSGVSLKQRDAI